MKKPYVLITNDDGIHALGIRHLWEQLHLLADLVIVAPHVERSGAGLGTTINEPLYLEEIHSFDQSPAWSVSGTPADCVKLALSVICERQPDLIVSGINRGCNSGRSILYSGTVGGVIEGVMHDIPGIAFSCWDLKNPHYSAAGPYIPQLVKYVFEHSLPKGTLLNVNFPPRSQGIHGIKLTRQGKECWMEDPAKRLHPVEEDVYYWLGGKLAQFKEEEDSDISWLYKGYATAVPIHIHELTDHKHLQQHKDRFDSFFAPLA